MKNCRVPRIITRGQGAPRYTFYASVYFVWLRMGHRYWLAFFALFALSAFPWLAGRAAADSGGSLPCQSVEAGSIHIDGLLSDWEGVPAVDLVVTAQPGVTGGP